MFKIYRLEEKARVLVVSVGAIAGLLPDVDISKSPAGRILFPISHYLEKRFPHRSCTHSILDYPIE